MAKPVPDNAFVPSGFFALRTPYLPFDALQDWSNDWTASGANDGRSLRTIFADPALRDALFVASPEFAHRVHNSIDRLEHDHDKKLERGLLRYYSRMASRPTPFGLFAGCSLGTMGPTSHLHVNRSCKRHTRLDMDYVVDLANALSRESNLRQSLRFTPNSSLYRVAGRLRYVEVRREGRGWSHHRCTLTVAAYLDVVLARAAEGATIAELTQSLLEHDPCATEQEAVEYIASLIDHQVLVSELIPAVTGPEPIHGLIERLWPLPTGGPTAERLAWVRGELATLDTGGPGAPPDRYRAIARRLSELPARVDTSRLFQVDTVRPPAGATLGENIVAEIKRGVELLRRLTPRPAEDALDAFRQAFEARFGDTPITREVPLAEALDDETGIMFGDAGETVAASSLLEGLEFPRSPNRTISWGPRESYLLARLTETLGRGHHEMYLTEQDIEALAIEDPLRLPDAFAALVRLEADSDRALDRGDFLLYLASVNGPSGAQMLGRFCHADPDLADSVAGHLRMEERMRPDATFAEVVHLPEGRVGNVLARPAFREYEIPYLGRSCVPVERQLPLSDLRVSVQEGRIVLRSARLGREILPRLSNAHNYEAGQSIYRFLCALQRQGVAASLGWDWGPLRASAFLPRVVYGRLVLARAQWRVCAVEAARLLAESDSDRFAAVQAWRNERRLPRWVCLVESDNELAIDLDNRLMVETLLSQLKPNESCVLVELFPAPDRLCALGDDGHYVHELVIPFVRQVRTEAATIARPRRSAAIEVAASPCRRVFAPGDEWLAVKLYAGSLTVDQLLTDVVGPLASELIAEGLIRCWFFVRYADPHSHLRLRLEGDPQRLMGEVLRRIQVAAAPLLVEGWVWKTQLDTYAREIERYGGPAGIELCEQLFQHDCDAVVELLRLDDGEDARGDRRWRLALLGMDRLLTDLGLDIAGKRDLLKQSQRVSQLDSNHSIEFTRRLGARYRAEAAAMERLLAPYARLDPQWLEAKAILDRRSLRTSPSIKRLLAKARLGGLTSSLSDLASSLLHMHANRLLRSAHHIQEVVLYHFLYRSYQRQLATCDDSK